MKVIHHCQRGKPVCRVDNDAQHEVTRAIVLKDSLCCAALTMVAYEILIAVQPSYPSARVPSFC